MAGYDPNRSDLTTIQMGEYDGYQFLFSVKRDGGYRCSARQGA